MLDLLDCELMDSQLVTLVQNADQKVVTARRECVALLVAADVNSVLVIGRAVTGGGDPSGIVIPAGPPSVIPVQFKGNEEVHALTAVAAGGHLSVSQLRFRVGTSLDGVVQGTRPSLGG